MRYFFIACFFSHLLVFNLIQIDQDRNPASYPNFSGDSAFLAPENAVVAPAPRKLGPPLNPNSVVSMKDIEEIYFNLDTGNGFLPQEIALKKEVEKAYSNLRHLLVLRKSMGTSYNSADSSSEIRKAIRAEQDRIALLQSRRAANSQFAYHDIQLNYAATQIGLKPESHRRVSELLGYVLHVFFEASSSTLSTTFAGLSSPYESTIAPMPEQFPGTVNSNATTEEEFLAPQNDSAEFIGPIMPEEKPITTAI